MSDPTAQVDRALLAEAARLLGCSDPAETIDRALAAVIRTERRDRAVAAELQRLGTGFYEPLAARRPAGGHR